MLSARLTTAFACRVLTRPPAVVHFSFSYLSSPFLPQNTELFNLTYGAMVAQVIRDFEDPREINAQLEQM